MCRLDLSSPRCSSGFCGHRRGRGPLAPGQSGDHRIIRGARYVDRRIFSFIFYHDFFVFGCREVGGVRGDVLRLLLRSCLLWALCSILGAQCQRVRPVPGLWFCRYPPPPTLDLCLCLLCRIICGLTQFTNKSHVAFAALEAVCFQTREVNKPERHAAAAVCGLIVNLVWMQILDAMNQDSGIPLTQLQVDGGMTSNRLLMQLQADILCIPVGEILFFISPPLLK